MFKMHCMILLLGHVLGDFYVQTNHIATKKEDSMRWVMLHSLIYSFAVLATSIVFARFDMLLASIVVCILHGGIDVCKYYYLLYKKKLRKKTLLVERNVFLIDQLLHIVCIITVSFFGVQQIKNITFWKWIDTLSSLSTIDISVVLYWIFSLLLIHKPANIIIQKLLMLYKTDTSNHIIKKDPNAGRLIGTLERFIMLLFLSIHQYVAIGLVLTAKSIARYDRISKEQDFAEYYLLGTLLSTAVVVVVSFIL